MAMPNRVLTWPDNSCLAADAAFERKALLIGCRCGCQAVPRFGCQAVTVAWAVAATQLQLQRGGCLDSCRRGAWAVNGLAGPWPRNSRTVAEATHVRAVIPRSSALFTSAPPSTSTVTMATSPTCAAHCSAVAPPPLPTLGPTPDLAMHLEAATGIDAGVGALFGCASSLTSPRCAEA